MLIKNLYIFCRVLITKSAYNWGRIGLLVYTYILQYDKEYSSIPFQNEVFENSDYKFVMI